MKKFLLIGGGIVAVLIVAVVALVIFVFSELDSIVKAAVEEVGSEATKTEVRLADVEISLTSGKGALRGLKVGNPSGFATDSAMSLGAISVDLNTETVGSDTIVIREVVIAKPEVTYEIDDKGNSNIQTIQKNVQSFAGGKSGASGKSSGSASSGSKDEGPKLVIENLYVRDGTVNVSASALKGQKMSAKLPTVHLKDIGKKQGGATPAEIAEMVIAAVGKNATRAVGTLNVDKLVKGISDKAMKEAGKEAEGVLKGALGKSGKEAEGALKNLLGK